MRGLLRAAAALALLTVWLLPSGQASAAGYAVAMKGYAFSPATLSVPAGSTVTWTNYDTAPHDVKTTSGPLPIHSPMLNKGQSWSFTFTTAGSYGYVCTVHPDMTAGITVRAAAPAPAPARTSAAPTRHAHSGSATHQEATTPTRTPSRAPRSAPAMTMPMPSSPPSSTAPEAVVPQPAQLPATQTAASTARPLDPLLVLAGLVAGVAVLCLLLVGSRTSRARAEDL
ncbi:cupredoxin family copper-binding protein [Streptomyces sp. NBC_00285]|uniref:cupredoxin domain-containing protein n=1 Tax=Streptomyces sp. NBC_00285 TaxID=2975700 RepID=UPI002E2D1F3B|nr:cupredoxin family copper-binding protein [Streptomyces sp. NBC_00285]